MFKISFLSFIVIFSFMLNSHAQQQPLQLNALFSDHMVLQQNDDVAFWGTYIPNEKVTVIGSWGEQADTKTDGNGNWKLNLKTPKAGGPFTVTISSNTTKTLLKDIMIGEVWLASGQSNMEMPLKGWPPNDAINNSEEEILKANHPNIRMFTVQRNMSMEPLNDIRGNWQTAIPNNAKDFSATAYFFAKRLYEELNVPIGIIHSSWGGTPAEAWTSKPKLKTLGDFDAALEQVDIQNHQKTIDKWFSKWDTTTKPNSNEDWKSLNFKDLKAAEKDYNDSNWSYKMLPGRFDDLKEGEIDGAIWFRKSVFIDDISSDYTLELGAIDDMDATYINGHYVGGFMGHGHSGTKRKFTVPKSILVNGKNTIAIRAIDAGGPGSFSGDMILKNKKGNQITLNGNWKYRLVAEIHNNHFYVYDLESTDFAERATITKMHPKIPSVLYNAMIHPLQPFTIKGAIWYQGEENVGRAEQYKHLFPAMIEDWRTEWNSDFPFYFTQLAPYQYHSNKDVRLDKSQKLRDAQRLTLKTRNTGMAVTLDIGNYNNIHPSNKQDVGFRLAGLALDNNYGKNIVSSGPLYKSVKISEDKLIIDFDFKGSGLKAKGNLYGFEIAGADKKFVMAEAEIVNNKIVVKAQGVNNPMYVRYAWRDKAVPTLFNIEGLPASSFTTLN
ncbi:sialate O-acetylesterase [Winogradskyella bathintestinalis]|uniref:Sialate O-acetylesterase n=1 Tax=Winogradskyella bathintestinalis TaxID=3035208 RepID=A0ABT7ZUT1_9FLAO|nr:sialate O-acetylesterase [Winogradskyella bathintestinalis]MDN3492733.1 sialate O-acetylesterase [Winogradskyella bathintestinalis]